MKQIIQDLNKGATILEEVPMPQAKPGQLLIRTTRSLVSLGTERMLVEFGKANLIAKARQQPDKVKMVLDKMRTEGVLPTLEAVFNKLNQPLPLGYCNVGIVEAIGNGVHTFNVGDRVASNGNHAEYVCVSENLAAKIPDNVTDEEAAFTVIGSIGLEGIRLCNPTFGETIVVIGLGLIGLVTSELLRANGCNVIGYDYDQQKVAIARSKGIHAFNPAEGTDPTKFVQQYTDQIGADCVIITASNPSDEIIHQAAEMSRTRGRIVLVGVVGLNLRRDDFYQKELTFQVSCSYGPGRYDENYEQKGQDYPIGFVRWTEKRNFQAVLNALANKQLDVLPLITEKVELDDYQQIYGNLRSKDSIASIITYSVNTDASKSISMQKSNKDAKFVDDTYSVGIIGAGNFASATLVPGLLKTNASIKYIADINGLSAKILAKKAKASIATSDYNEMLKDDALGSVIITTRHDLHAKMVIESLVAGKNVMVEKPLCLNQSELDAIIEAVNRSKRMVTVGFNRRFAPLVQKLKKLIGDGPMNIVATMNAGYISPDMWVHDLEIGGGRIIGEACHYIDLCTYISGSLVKSVCMNGIGPNPKENTDNASILLQYENGTNAVINYIANGSKAYAKERIEVHNQGKTLVIDNWRTLTGYDIKGFSKKKTRLDKGSKRQYQLFVESLNTGLPIIQFQEIVNTTKASFAAIKSLKEQRWISVE
jgi:predicted dehydrogenase/threonine dehydrogenase-like Zn-dependent dehydrogenase